MSSNNDTNTFQGGEEDGPDALSNAVSAYQSMAGQFDDFTAGDVEDEPGVKLPLDSVLKMLPANYLVKQHGDLSDKTVFVGIPDLYDQLRKGKVSISIRDLAARLPASMLHSGAFDDQTMVDLPLPAVVSALDPTALKSSGDKRKARKYDITDIRDPFKKIEGPVMEVPAAAPPEAGAPEKPAVTEQAVQEKPVIEVEPPAEVEPEKAVTEVEPPAEPEPEEPSTEPEEPVSEVEPPAEPEPKEAEQTIEPAHVPSPPKKEEPVFEPVYGININTADAKQIMSIGGISLVVARRIVEYRTSHGVFDSIFSLCNVPGLGRKTFRKLTGMPYSEKGRHRAARLARLLGIPLPKISHIPTVAEAVGRVKGISGCVFSDKDGLMIAEHRAGEFAESVAAVSSEIMEQLSRKMAMIGTATPTSVSISAGERLITVAQSGDTYLTVIHEANRITGAQLKLIQTVARELAWAFSRIAYVGPAG